MTDEKKEMEASRLLRKIEGEIEEANAKHNRVLAAINTDKQTSQDLENDVTQKTRKVGNLDTEIKRLSDIKKGYEKRIDEQNETIKTTDKTLGDKANEVKTLDKVVETHEASIMKLNEASDDKVKIAEEKVSKAREEKGKLDVEIKMATQRLATVKEATEEVLQQNVRLSGEVSDKNRVITALEKEIDTKRAVLTDIEESTGPASLALTEENTKLEATKKELDTLEATQDSLIEEIDELRVKRDKATEEYDTESTKLFAIAKREAHVKQQELHIKDQFEKAGIKYTEFDPG